MEGHIEATLEALRVAVARLQASVDVIVQRLGDGAMVAAVQAEQIRSLRADVDLLKVAAEVAKVTLATIGGREAGGVSARALVLSIVGALAAGATLVWTLTRLLG